MERTLKVIIICSNNDNDKGINCYVYVNNQMYQLMMPIQLHEWLATHQVYRLNYDLGDSYIW